MALAWQILIKEQELPVFQLFRKVDLQDTYVPGVLRPPGDILAQLCP